MKIAKYSFLILTVLLLYSCSNNKPSSIEEPKAVNVQPEEVEQNNSIPSQQIDYETYLNSRYGYSITYPTFLTPQPEACNGDGRVFTNGNNEEMRVYAVYNVLERSIQDLKEIQEDMIDGSIDYSVQKKNWFVLSGINSDGNIYYLKTILNEDTEYTVQITYPKEKKELYDEIVEKVTKSFCVE